MPVLIWGGAALSLVGVAGLVYCIMLALRARRSGLPEDDVRAQLQRVVTLNMGALGVSALGLMLVVTGILLG
jgi:soluble lytic murein transglycosylase-like protein